MQEEMFYYNAILLFKKCSAVSASRPYVWGEKCLEHETLKKSLGQSLWKQLTTEEVLNLLDKSHLQQSITSFPLTRSLDVR